VGDPVYGGGGHRRVTGQQRPAALALERVTPRQALHAAMLRLAHPESREWMEFRAPWPSDLDECLAVAAGEPTLVARSSKLHYLGFFQQDG
jgi:23S rRNA pseudouridine1911/1915/1917 synthase